LSICQSFCSIKGGTCTKTPSPSGVIRLTKFHQNCVGNIFGSSCNDNSLNDKCFYFSRSFPDGFNIVSCNCLPYTCEIDTCIYSSI
jgi:hypothetical protein